jgi:hypothetical protein
MRYRNILHRSSVCFPISFRSSLIVTSSRQYTGILWVHEVGDAVERGDAEMVVAVGTRGEA